MNAVCATILWAGRTLCPSMFQERSSVSVVSIMPNFDERRSVVTNSTVCGTVGR